MNIIQILFNPPSSFPRFEPDVFSLILVLLDVIKFLNSNRRDGYRLVEFAAWKFRLNGTLFPLDAA